MDGILFYNQDRIFLGGWPCAFEENAYSTAIAGNVLTLGQSSW